MPLRIFAFRESPSPEIHKKGVDPRTPNTLRSTPSTSTKTRKKKKSGTCNFTWSTRPAEPMLPPTPLPPPPPPLKSTSHSRPPTFIIVPSSCGGVEVSTRAIEREECRDHTEDSREDDDMPYDERRDHIARLEIPRIESRSEERMLRRRRQSRASRLVVNTRGPLPLIDTVRPVPKVFLASGFRVTMIDWAHKVFVVDLLTAQLCHYIRDLCDAATVPEQWRILYTHTKADCPAQEISGVGPLLKVVSHNVRNVLADLFRTEKVHQLHERSWKEPHLLKYKKNPGKEVSHTGVRMHHDGSDMTWSLMLSEMHEYSGGGTYFQALRRTLKLHIGQVLVHPGDLLHKGVDIRRGERRLAVCFMDGFHPGVQDLSSVYSHHPDHEKNVLVT